MTQLTPIRGFTNTPATRALIITSTLVALGLSILQLKHYVRIAIDPFLLEYLQYWRVATYQLSVVSESDYLLCTLLWFHYKNLERFYGLRRYLSLVVIFALYNCLVCVLVMSVGQLLLNMASYFVFSVLLGRNQPLNYHDTFFNEIAPGPYGIISSLYVCYGMYVPVSYHFKIALSPPSDDVNAGGGRDLTLTNHFPIHVLYTLLLLNNGVASFVPCVIGLLIGKLHGLDLLPGSKSWLLPSWTFRMFTNPQKFTNSTVAFATRSSRGGYSSLGQEDPTRAENGTFSDGENGADAHNDEREEVVDEIRDNRNEIRAETPVRPLGSQLLDTFRT